MVVQRTIQAGVLALMLSASAALAQSEDPFGGFKHDSSQPIEITADSLEVQQANNKAIFLGKVVAGQGTLRLTADRVEVTYNQDQTDSRSGAIDNMKANGNVFLSNGAETAKGARAEYDVGSGFVRMWDDVLLTQGQNAISGDRLTIDLNTGVGKVEGNIKVVFLPEQESN